jgi:hypothetical protein
MANLWPSTLPETFEAGSYREQLSMNTIATNPEAGSRIVRKRFSASPLVIQGSMILSVSQRDTLKTFFDQQQALRWQWTNLIRASIRYYDFLEPPGISAISGFHYRADLKLLEYTTEFGGA